MQSNDTVKLLRECDAGIEMGTSAIADVLQSASSHTLKSTLQTCKDEHDRLKKQVRLRLDSFNDDGKNPNPMAKGMSWIKTNVKLAAEESDATIADLITDGCNMGVKSLNRYLNQYKAADENSKDITKRLIKLEQKLAADVEGYL